MDKKAIFPNIITFLNLFCGFASIYFSFTQSFSYAASMILSATIFDMLDGKIARMLNIKSQFGKELDSFSDLVSFGLAPAFFVMNLAFIFTNNLTPTIKGVILIISFFYVVTATLRLATYNSKTSLEDINLFTGLPTTFAAIAITTILGFNYIPSLVDLWLPKYVISIPIWLTILIFVFYTLLMISKFKYTKSNKNLFNFRSMGKILYNIAFIIILVIALKYFLVMLVLIYTFSPFFRSRNNAN